MKIFIPKMGKLAIFEDQNQDLKPFSKSMY